jgi:hypothetical protein
MLKNFFKKALELHPKTALFLRTLRDQMDRNDPPIKTPWGFTLAGSEFMAGGTFEPEETH